MTVRTDADLARSWAQGDPLAPEAAIARHGADLLVCAGWMTGHPDAASDAVRATFVRAGTRVARLRDPERFPEWLFAILRNECLLRPAPLARVVPVAGLGADAGEVWRAAQALDARDREVFALHVCAGLDVGQIAAALGVKVGAAAVRVGQMRQALTDACTALDLLRHGRSGCPALVAAVPVEPSAPFTAEVRARVERHAAACERCGRWPAPYDDALEQIEALPAVAVPLALVGQVRAASEHADDLDVLPPVWSWRDDGFPVPLDDRGDAAVLGFTWRQVGVVGTAAVLLVAAAFGLAAVWPGALSGPGDGDVRAAVDAAPRATQSPVPAARPTTTPTASPTVPLTTAATPSPTASPAARPAVPAPRDTSGGHGSAPTAAPRPTHDTPPQPPAVVSVGLQPSAVDLADDRSTAVVRITARGTTPQTFTADTAGTWLSVTPESGTLAPGRSVDLTVRVARKKAPEGRIAGTLAVRWGDATASIPLSAVVRRAPEVTDLWAAPGRVHVPGWWCFDTTTSVTAVVRDESPVSGVLTYRLGGGDTVRRAMEQRGDRWVARLGPFRNPGQLSGTVTFTDEYGGRASRDLRVTVDPC